MDRLTQQQKAFADYVLETGNQTEAYLKAYQNVKKNDTAAAAASRLLRNVKVSAYIAERQKQIEDSRIANVTEILQFFSSVMRNEEKDQFGLDASLSDRITAGKELMKRYEKSDDGRKDALQKLDEVLKEIGGVI